jgi:hypothetical protein
MVIDWRRFGLLGSRRRLTSAQWLMILFSR